MSELVITARGFARARTALNRLGHLDTVDLLDNVGAMVESQTRRRITQQEGPPEGGNWEPYSPGYAKWKASVGKGSAGFLRLFGHLLDSIQYLVSGDEVEIGSNLDYANANQATRPFLGLSDENEDDIEQLTVDWLREVMGVTL